MYSYPIDYEIFNKKEISDIIKFLNMIELYNETKRIDKENIVNHYRIYQKIINSKLIEKQIDRDFLKTTGYSIYKSMKSIINN